MTTSNKSDQQFHSHKYADDLFPIQLVVLPRAMGFDQFLERPTYGHEQCL